MCCSVCVEEVLRCSVDVVFEVVGKVCSVFDITYFLEFCFFFQAEDGIRDVAVTGVQTCALPI